MSTMIEPSQMDVPESILEDLEWRLGHARWPDSVIDAAWRYGTNIEYLRSLVAYWLVTFDWREQAARLNQIPQYRAASPAGHLHLVWRRAVGGHNLPLLLANGWAQRFGFLSSALAPRKGAADRAHRLPQYRRNRYRECPKGAESES